MMVVQGKDDQTISHQLTKSTEQRLQMIMHIQWKVKVQAIYFEYG